MLDIFIPVSPRDQVLITRTRRAEDVGHTGGVTSNDPRSCWLKFRYKPQLHQNSCILAPALLPDLSTSQLPTDIIVETLRVGRPLQTERPTVIDTRDGLKIPLGDFPRGNVKRIAISFPDGEQVAVTETDRPGRFPDQTTLRFSLSAGLRAFGRYVLQAVRRNLGTEGERPN